MNTINKIDASTMEVVKNIPIVEPVKTTYTMDFLKSQELSILKSMNDFIDARQVELADVRALIDQATSLGLKTQAEIQADTVKLEEEKLNSQTISE